MRKNIYRILTLALILGLGMSVLDAQITTNGTGGGLWNAASTWAGGVVPSGSGTITIAANDSVVFNVPVTITGTLVKQSAKRDSIGAGGSLTFANGGTYQHDVNAGYIPTATWATGSTYLLTGYTGNKPQNGSQNFYNVTFNLSSAYTAPSDLSWLYITLGGNLRATNTNNTQLRLTSPTGAAHGPIPNWVTVNGNFIVDSASSIGLNGSGTADTVSITIKGDFTSKGTVSMGGSGLNATWYVQGNVSILGGAFSGHSAHTDSLVFIGTTKQKYYTTLASMANVWTRVRTGAIVDLDTCKIGNHSKQAFVMEPGSTVITAHALGLAGNLNNSALKDLSKQAGFTYDGIVAQADSLLPDTLKNLTINNPAGFALSRATVVTGVLTLQAGQLDNSVYAVTIAPGGSVVRTGGRIKVPIPGFPATGVESQEGIPHTFALSQNYPNPFNPATTISYALPRSGSVKIVVYDLFGREVESLVNASRTAGYYQATFNASKYASGTYFYRLIVDGTVIEARKMMLLK